MKLRELFCKYKQRTALCSFKQLIIALYYTYNDYTIPHTNTENKYTHIYIHKYNYNFFVLN